MSEPGVPSASALSKLSDKIKSQLEGGSKNNTKKDTKPATPSKNKDSKKAPKNEKKEKKDKKGKKENTEKSAPKENDGNENEDVLLREIKNFGGSAADLDLIGDISDAESVVDFGNDKSSKTGSDKNLESDIFKFMNELGLKGSDKDFVIKDDDEEAQEPVPKLKKEKKEKEKKEELKDAKKEKKEKADKKEVKESKDKTEKKDDKKAKKEKNGKKDAEKNSEETELKTKDNKKASKKEAELEERKKQFNTSTANDIDQIMNDIGTLESGETVFNAHHTKNQLILPPRSDWYNPEIEEPKISDVELSDIMVERLYTKAKNLLAKENELFTHENNKTNSQKQFLSQLLTAGTLSDKIGAYSLLIQESPLHSVKYLTSLLSLCRKKSRGSALQSIASLKDIFIQGGVLPDRKLRWFKNQPGLSSFASPEWLIVWAFEDWLKQYFFSLIQILEVSSILLLHCYLLTLLGSLSRHSRVCEIKYCLAYS